MLTLLGKAGATANEGLPAAMADGAENPETGGSSSSSSSSSDQVGDEPHGVEVEVEVEEMNVESSSRPAVRPTAAVPIELEVD